jgi:hypothetical protein
MRPEATWSYLTWGVTAAMMLWVGLRASVLAKPAAKPS